jgi:hypothetical protein
MSATWVALVTADAEAIIVIRGRTGRAGRDEGDRGGRLRAQSLIVDAPALTSMGMYIRRWSAGKVPLSVEAPLDSSGAGTRMIVSQTGDVALRDECLIRWLLFNWNQTIESA